MTNRQELYDSIKDVVDVPTRNILYIQFVGKYYPEAFQALSIRPSLSTGSVWPDFDGE